jgi:tRNA threonylcarbamoyladenosine biosynthesis protein TsaB
MLLAVDTSTAQVGLALYHGQQLIAETIWYSGQRHTVELAPALSELLRRASVTIDDVEALGVAIGPGSFTALRVGLALAKGLALARKLPIVGIATLDVLAAGQPVSPMRLAAVLQAGRGRIAVGWYLPPTSGSDNGHPVRCVKEGGWEPEGAAEVMTVEGLGTLIDRPTLVAGELTQEERHRLERDKVNVVLAAPHLCVRRPSILAELAEERWRGGRVDAPGALAPIYLQLNASIRA